MSTPRTLIAPYLTPLACVSRCDQLCCSTHLKIAREWAITLPSGSLSAGSFVSPVAWRSSSREPLRRKGIGLPWAAITFSYSMPAPRSASCTRRQGCLRGPPSSPWQTNSVGFSAIVVLQLGCLTSGTGPPSTGSRKPDHADAFLSPQYSIPPL